MKYDVEMGEREENEKGKEAWEWNGIAGTVRRMGEAEMNKEWLCWGSNPCPYSRSYAY